MSAPLSCFNSTAWAGCISVVLGVLDCSILGVLVLFLFGFCIFGMSKDFQKYSWILVKLKHELALQSRDKGKKKDLVKGEPWQPVCSARPFLSCPSVRLVPSHPIYPSRLVPTNPVLPRPVPSVRPVSSRQSVRLVPSHPAGADPRGVGLQGLHLHSPGISARDLFLHQRRYIGAFPTAKALF